MIELFTDLLPIKIHVSKEHELAPNQTDTWHWNHAAEVNAVWTANAVLIRVTDYSKQSQDSRLEVTRLWRRYQVVDNSLGQTANDTAEHEIYYEVRNVGPETARFKVYLCATWE